MKQIAHITILMSCICLISCKSPQHVTKSRERISTEDFRSLDANILKDSKVVRLSEVVYVRMESFFSLPWDFYSSANHYNDSYHGGGGWKTMVRDKIRIFTDNINDESSCFITYYYPQEMRWDLMTECKMWLYSLDNTNQVHQREIKKNEIIQERMNDSICRVRLNIQENVVGKVLVREYTLIRPYYAYSRKTALLNSHYDLSAYPVLAPIETWIFQKEIPLLYGSYQIFLPDEEDIFSPPIPMTYKVLKLGNGKMDINEEKSEDADNSTQLGHSYKATKVTVTVSDIMPLPKGSDVQPFGVKIISMQGKRIQ